MNPSLRELGVIKLATPCTMKWSEMTAGADERVRHCGACVKNVFNVQSMSADEVRELVLKTEGRLCFRFFVRPDGTMLTKDCPVGLAAVRRKMLLSMAAVMILGTTLLLTVMQAFGASVGSCARTRGVLAGFVDRLDRAAKVVRTDVGPSDLAVAGGIRASPMMGEIAPAPVATK